MKRITVLMLPLLLALVALSSCKKETPLAAEEATVAQLRAGSWAVTRMEQNTFEGGTLVSSDLVLFGEGEAGGLCTFTYGEDGTWVMDDNGEVFQFAYELDDNIINTQGGGQWGIRQMSDTYLELALRGQESYNPCSYGASGAVYYLNRPQSR